MKSLRTGSAGSTFTTELFLPCRFGAIVFLSCLRHFTRVNKIELNTMNYFKRSLVISTKLDIYPLIAGFISKPLTLFSSMDDLQSLVAFSQPLHWGPHLPLAYTSCKVLIFILLQLWSRMSSLPLLCWMGLTFSEGGLATPLPLRFPGDPRSQHCRVRTHPLLTGVD